MDHRSDCSYRSSLFWVHAVCFYTQFVSYVKQLFAADDIFRCIFFLGALRVKLKLFACWVVLHAFLSSADFKCTLQNDQQNIKLFFISVRLDVLSGLIPRVGGGGSSDIFIHT